MNLRQGRIGTRESVAMIGLAVLSKLLCQKLELFALNSSNVMWFTGAAAVLVAGIMFALCLYLLRDGGDLVSGLNNNLGRLGGSFFSLLICALLLFSAAQTMSSFYLVLTLYIYPNTNPLLLLALVALCAGVPAYMGLECVSRTARFFFPILIIVLLCLVIFPWRQYDASRLYPIAGEGFMRELAGGVPASVMYIDVIALAMLTVPLQGKKQVKRVGFWALSITFFATTLVLLAVSLTFSSGLLNEMVSPIYSLATNITMNRSHVRVDDYLMFLWIMCSALGIAFNIYLVSNVFCRTTGAGEIRPVVPLVCLLCVALAMLIQISPAFYKVAERFVSSYGYWIVLGPVALASLVAFVKRRRRPRAKEADA